jgi:hypothetical protein
LDAAPLVALLAKRCITPFFFGFFLPLQPWQSRLSEQHERIWMDKTLAVSAQQATA